MKPHDRAIVAFISLCVLAITAIGLVLWVAFK